MNTQAQELEQKTQVYWKLSQVWNGKRQVKITTGESMEICQNLLTMVDYNRPLSYRTDGLLQEIIKGEGNKWPPAKIYVLPIKQGATA